MRIFSSLATSTRQLREGISQVRQSQKNSTITTAILACLNQYSQGNNYPQKIIGLFCYTHGATRQLFAFLSHLSITESYSNLVRKGRSVVEAVLENKSAETSEEPVQCAQPVTSMGASQNVDTGAAEQERKSPVAGTLPTSGTLPRVPT
ncbi:hypothetical protein K435DRAFT_881533 [Dendrothele bispora CBS 962.96]|uniref:Uncharacterized protein n=1 Tax=Dendrothele bispora (strain CBS 962.96) TaxID=1314807 RepID=A0A4S8KIB8_DENBC|nr:hypothetical protein K435DRAFT_881533 [Dendrothele bispora CBS 962.96]